MNNSLYTWLSEYIDFDNLGGNAGGRLYDLVVDLFISDICNLNCKHCYFGETSIINKPLSIHEWQLVIGSLYDRGVRHFHISGRESSLDKRVLEVISRIKSFPNTYTGLVSNGTGDVSFYSSAIQRGIDYLEFSLDGQKDTHDFIRGRAVFSDVLELIKKLHENCAIIDVSTCLNKNSLTEYLSLVEQCMELGIRRFFATPFYEKGRGKEMSSYSIKPYDYSLLMQETQRFMQKHKDYGVIIKYCVPHDLTISVINQGPFFKQLLIDYLEGRSGLVFKESGNLMQLALNLFDIDFLHNISITTDGEVIPCADDISIKKYNKSSIGNVIKNDIDSILKRREERISETIKAIINGN